MTYSPRGQVVYGTLVLCDFNDCPCPAGRDSNRTIEGEERRTEQANGLAYRDESIARRRFGAIAATGHFVRLLILRDGKPTELDRRN
jgi:hypothetical protein